MCDVAGAWHRLPAELRSMLVGKAQAEGIDLERHVQDAPWVIWPLLVKLFGPIYGRGILCLLAEEMGVPASTAIKVMSSREAWEERCVKPQRTTWSHVELGVF